MLCVIGGGGALTSTKPKGQHQCHTCGLQWPAPRAHQGCTSAIGNAQKGAASSQCQCSSQHHHQGNFHGAQGSTTTRHAQRQAWNGQVPFPLAMIMGHCHAQGRLGATPKASPSKKCMPQSISQANRAKPLGAPPTLINHSQPQKWGVAGPADCALATLVRVNDFLERIPPIKANPVGEGRDPFHRLRK